MVLTAPRILLGRRTALHLLQVTRKPVCAFASFRRGHACGKPAQRAPHPTAGFKSVPRARSLANGYLAANELDELAGVGSELFVILPPMSSESQPKLAPSRMDTTVGTMAFIGDISLPSKIRPAMLPKP